MQNDINVLQLLHLSMAEVEMKSLASQKREKHYFSKNSKSKLTQNGH